MSGAPPPPPPPALLVRRKKNKKITRRIHMSRRYASRRYAGGLGPSRVRTRIPTTINLKVPEIVIRLIGEELWRAVRGRKARNTINIPVRALHTEFSVT